MQINPKISPSFLAGRDAYFADRTREDNPNKKDSEYFEEWDKGFRNAPEPPAMDLTLQSEIQHHVSSLCKDSNSGNARAKLVIGLHEDAILINSTLHDVEQLRKAFTDWLNNDSDNRVNA